MELVSNLPLHLVRMGNNMCTGTRRDDLRARTEPHKLCWGWQSSGHVRAYYAGCDHATGGEFVGQIQHPQQVHSLRRKLYKEI
jgi:hypothetical protein